MDALEKLMSGYKRHGGKSNRAEQVAKIRTAMQWLGITHPKQFTNHLVIKFYKHLRNEKRADKTIYNYYLSFKQLYQVLGRESVPLPGLTGEKL
jgi:hypothetical protein